MFTPIEMTYKAGGAKIPGCFFLPEGRGPFAVVVVLHGSDGFQPNHAEIGQKLAAAGFASLVVAWFGASSDRSHWDMVRPGDIFEAVSWLKKEPAVDSNRLGLIGFSRGGGLALVMGALIPETKAIVNYFGLTAWKGGLEEFCHLPLNKSEHLDFVKNISCPIISFHGEKDTVVTVDNTLQLDSACQKYGIDHTVILYPDLDHSFVWPGDKYNKKAHLDSWNTTIRFFKTHLIVS
ncbi:MAG: dienelactone hydrolase family protein [Desulfobacterales bacterium]